MSAIPERPIETISDQILVAASVIADISSGIYRSPANALKELISNSFDADAKNVTISTGHPEFEAMTCVDDGSGMTFEEFRKYMHAIGSSYKRVEKDYTPSGRPKIGKIGIGILAVGQICRKFSVISSTGNGRKFEAEINLAEFEAIEKEKKPLGQIGIGEYSGEIYREERQKKYTTLVLKDMRDDFRKRLLESQSPKAAIKDFRAKQAQPLNFIDFVEWLRGKKIQELSEYDRLIWGLSIAAPVEYLDDGPIRGFAGLRELKRRLKSYDFKVTVDGLEIRKPLLFPFGKDLKYRGRDYWVYDDIAYESESDGAKLKLSGYVYAQRKRISPPEYQGLLIRIRNVAIGGYDRSLLSYPKSEGPGQVWFQGRFT